jgi:hypothetical protein
MDITISPEEQMLVFERLYRSQDSISSTQKFNATYGAKIGKMADRTLRLNDFYRALRQTDFPRLECKQAIKEITGHEVELY